MTIRKSIDFRFKERAASFLPYLLFFLWFFGAKLVLIARYGNPTPFGDQWDGEARDLYLPWLKGTLSLSDLLSPHNEHRIFTTKLWDLFLLKINGGLWDPIFQMVSNAVIHVVALTLLLYFLSKSLPKPLFWPLLVFTGVLFSFPFDFENTLWGFQAQWYFLLFFTMIFLWAMIRYPPLSPLWWVGFGCGELSALSLASGAVTLAAGLGVLLVRWIKEKERNRPIIIALVLVATAFVVSVVLTPHIPYHDRFRAHSIHEFLKSLATAMAWPAPPIGAVLISLPLCLFLLGHLRRRLSPFDASWFVFACGLWVLGQFAILSYGRANGNVLSTRYLDLYSIGLILDFFCLLFFLSRPSEKKWTLTLAKVGTTLWILIATISFAKEYNGILDSIRDQTLSRLEEEKNVRAYLDTHDFSFLQNKLFPQFIPYPDAPFLRSMLDDSMIANILPSDLTGRQERLDPPFGERMTEALFSLVPHSQGSDLFDEISGKKPIVRPVASVTCEGFIDSINGISPPPSELKMVNTLSIEGWMTVSGARGLVPDEIYITLSDPLGQMFYAKARKRTRPDVAKAFHHEGLWGMDDAGFISNIDLSKFQGTYVLGLSRVYKGTLESCQNFSIRLNNIRK